MANLSADIKKFITRYIRLNQPCSLARLTNDICYNKNGPKANVQDVFTYLYHMTQINEIIFEPDIFAKDFKDFKGYTTTNLRKQHIDALIFIPDYFVWLWKNWLNKKILEDK